MTALKTRPASAGTAYADDFYTWTQEQGTHLRAGDVSRLDRENLAEEIESLGRIPFASLVNALRVVQWLAGVPRSRTRVTRFASLAA